MKTEYEVRVIEIDKDEIIKKLEKLGAVKKGEYFQKRYVYDVKPENKSRWIRLRTNGEKTTLALKDVTSHTIDGTKEIEFEVSSMEEANEFLHQLGFDYRNYQENKRIQYVLDDVEIDIDTWPMIPTYMEIEASSEEKVLKMIEKLDVDKSKITALNCEDIYRDMYNIEQLQIKELKFE